MRKWVGDVWDDINANFWGDKFSSVNIASNDDLFFHFIGDRAVFLWFCNEDVFIVGIVFAGELFSDAMITCFKKFGWFWIDFWTSA